MPRWFRAAPFCLSILSVCAAGPGVDSLAFAARPAQAAAAAAVDEAQLLSDLEFLASPKLEGRLTGSAGNERARSFILERFKQLKLQPVDGSYTQAFSFAPARGGASATVPKGMNVMGMVPGTSEPRSYVLVTAHYDHLGVRDGRTYPGADDNASGVGALLAAARWFSEHPPRKSVVFVAFDAEEQGLRGARHFVAQPPIDLARILVVLNMDMVGRGDKNVLYVAGTHHYPALRPVVEEAMKGRSIKVLLGHDHASAQAAVGLDDWTNQSDQGAFHAVQVPFLYFGVEDHPDYHKPTDTADRIPRPFYTAATAFVIDVARRFAD